MVEKIHLDAGDAQIVQALKDLPAPLGVTVVAAVKPKPDADAALLRVLDQLADLLVGPAAPQALDDLVLESQLAGDPRELLDHREPSLPAVYAAVLALLLDRRTVEIPPHRTPRAKPGGLHPLREECRVGGRAQVVDGIAVDQGSQLGADEHHAPPSGGRPPNWRRRGRPFGVRVSVTEHGRVAGGHGVPQPLVKPALAVPLKHHSRVIAKVRLGNRRVASSG